MTLDGKVIERLRLDVGAEVLLELIDAYLDDSPKLLDEARRAIAAGDVDGATRAAHSLKSTSQTLGLMALGEVAAELEALNREGSLKQAQAKMAAALKGFQAAKKALARHRRALARLR